MTRINLVSPSELSRQHLIAEYRELPRIFGLVRAAIARGELPNDKRNPLVYTLGPGHCRFFYPRLKFLKIRMGELILEMTDRGYKCSYGVDPLADIPLSWMGNYLPIEEALAINRARIRERTNDKTKNMHSIT